MKEKRIENWEIEKHSEIVKLISKYDGNPHEELITM
jgi:hypothetical protein